MSEINKIHQYLQGKAEEATSIAKVYAVEYAKTSDIKHKETFNKYTEMANLYYEIAYKVRDGYFKESK